MRILADTEEFESSAGSDGSVATETSNNDAPRTSSPQDTDSGATDEDSPPSGGNDNEPVAMSPANKRLEALLSGKQPETDDSPSSEQPGEAGQPTGESAPSDEPDGPQAKPAKPGALSQEQEQVFTKAFSERPEWKEALRLAGPANEKAMRGTLRKVFQRETALASQVETLKPAAQITERIKRCTGDEVGMENSVRLIEGWFEGTDEAEKMLEGLLTDMRARKGKTIVSADLKDRLAKAEQQFQDAYITEEQLQQIKQDLLEIEGARAGQKSAEGKVKQVELTTEQRQQEKLINDRTTALNTWEKAKARSDADYAVIQRAVADRAKSLAEEAVAKANGRWLSPKEITDIAEEAYKQVKAEFGQAVPRRRAKLPPPNDGGSSAELGEQEPSDPAQAILWRRARQRR